MTSEKIANITEIELSESSQVDDAYMTNHSEDFRRLLDLQNELNERLDKMSSQKRIKTFSNGQDLILSNTPFGLPEHENLEKGTENEILQIENQNHVSSQQHFF